MDNLFGVEALLRLGLFLGMLAAMVAWETAAPRRPATASRRQRWPGNLGLAALGALLVRVAFPLTAVQFGALAEARGCGLLGQLALPVWAKVVLAVVALDLAIYLQHVVLHAIPALWRLHRVHHADPLVDATTGVRFHPIEIGLSMLVKLAAIMALGAPALAVLVFEIALNAGSLFNHGNVMLPGPIERLLRGVLVTPDMHRVHHSMAPAEHSSNFGFTLSCWDRLFGTYCPKPAAGHRGMQVGLAAFRAPEQQRLDRMLLQPFLGRGAAADAWQEPQQGASP